MLNSRFGTLLFLGLILGAGCQSVKTITHTNQEVSTPVDYSIVIYIHGDDDYLFHDADGNAVQADQHALEKAVEAAERAGHGEVFIFHHRAQKKILGLFPRNTNRVYHYRGGERQNELSYRLSSDQDSFLQMEAELYKSNRLADPIPDHPLYFLYFGHEIPESPNQGYHRSRPEVEVHTESFVSGMQRFLDGDDTFSMVGLSTCNNGTPTMMAEIKGVAEVVIASPQNLHLSHLDIGGLSLLETDRNISPISLADKIAEDTFGRLSHSVQTAITLSVFNITEISPYVTDLGQYYQTYLTNNKPNMMRDNIDCSQLQFFNFEHYTDGVRSLFQPAAFGRSSGVATHQGWGCKPL